MATCTAAQSRRLTLLVLGAWLEDRAATALCPALEQNLYPWLDLLGAADLPLGFAPGDYLNQVSPGEPASTVLAVLFACRRAELVTAFAGTVQLPPDLAAAPSRYLLTPHGRAELAAAPAFAARLESALDLFLERLPLFDGARFRTYAALAAQRLRFRAGQPVPAPRGSWALTVAQVALEASRNAVLDRLYAEQSARLAC